MRRRPDVRRDPPRPAATRPDPRPDAPTGRRDELRRSHPPHERAHADADRGRHEQQHQHERHVAA
ncbi:MAG: hypothetical protein ACXVEH_08575, partial [Nocardioides sp.]